MILVTGAGGMTGSHLLDVYQEHELYRTDLMESPGIFPMDIRSADQVMDTVRSVKPRLVIHLAAETDVDRSEREPDHAFRSNVVGTLNIVIACQRYGADLVYVSTAGLFDGSKTDPYTEFDAPGPVNVYARSKLEGERIVQSLYPRHYIVRAGWMFGGRHQDKKFVGKIASMCLNGSPEKVIRAVDDKMGSPTYAKNLLESIRMITETGFYGLYHMVNAGRVTRYDIAVEIARFLGSSSRVEPTSSDSFKLPADRPRSECAQNYKLELMGLNRMQDWRGALHEYLRSWVQVPSQMLVSDQRLTRNAALSGN